METVTLVLTVVAVGVIADVAAAIYIIKNRPAIIQRIRSILGTSQLQSEVSYMRVEISSLRFQLERALDEAEESEAEAEEAEEIDEDQEYYNETVGYKEYK